MEEKKRMSPLTGAVLGGVAALTIAGLVGYWTGFIGPKHDLSHLEAHGEEHAAGEDQLYSCGMHPWIIQEGPGNCPICGMDLTPKRDEDPTGGVDLTERRVVYYRAPMDPTEIYHEPGKSKMGMDLVPVYEDELVGGVEVKIDPVTQQNMGIRTSKVEVAELVHTIRTYGHVTYDEGLTAKVSSKFSGWIEKLHVDITGQKVAEGQPLFEIYSPEIVTAQEEYLVAFASIKKGGAGYEELLESARKRLSYFDVDDREIREIERAGVARKTVTIRSPFKGVITGKNIVEGDFVKKGTVLFTVSDLSRVWVEAHIFEYELPWVNEGDSVVVTFPYLPGRSFEGNVAYVYPYLQAKTRDVVLRLEFENPEMELKPDMYGDVLVKVAPQGEGLVIPSEAVIRSGERNLVFVARGAGKFSPREVELGLSMEGGRVQTLSGVAPGEEVVTSGQFLLDSESKLKEAVQKMLEARALEAKETMSAEDDFFADVEEEDEEDFFKDMEAEQTEEAGQ